MEGGGWGWQILMLVGFCHFLWRRRNTSKWLIRAENWQLYLGKGIDYLPFIVSYYFVLHFFHVLCCIYIYLPFLWSYSGVWSCGHPFDPVENLVQGLMPSSLNIALVRTHFIRSKYLVILIVHGVYGYYESACYGWGQIYLLL